ncbi:hypothetical protein AC579_1381 [Pseudocercospora musae]|uniref:Uncharacterized protein n=1 Tax=Pseudocercospora musae TaxID=113226 RepID=A0A139IKP2_9PEZI|nr:hypothetical protein AC579_1381 [Pseudocercospora musae]
MPALKDNWTNTRQTTANQSNRTACAKEPGSGLSSARDITTREASLTEDHSNSESIFTRNTGFSETETSGCTQFNLNTDIKTSF